MALILKFLTLGAWTLFQKHRAPFSDDPFNVLLGPPKTKTAHNGDIVVALVEMTDATLKRFYREGDKIRLQPSNAAMQPIIVPAASVEIQGRVIGVLRKY